MVVCISNCTSNLDKSCNFNFIMLQFLPFEMSSIPMNCKTCVWYKIDMIFLKKKIDMILKNDIRASFFFFF